AGPTGTVVLLAQSLLNGVNPAAGAGIGTLSQPIVVRAGSVTVTSVNSFAIVEDTVAAGFTGNVTGPGVLKLTTDSGDLTIAGNSSGDVNGIILNGSAGVVLSADLGKASMAGPTTITAGSNGINQTAGKIVTASTLAAISAGPVNLGSSTNVLTTVAI